MEMRASESISKLTKKFRNKSKNCHMTPELG